MISGSLLNKIASNGAGRKVYIHVGIHKTGTTSIQAFLETHKSKLLEQDITVLQVDEDFHVLAYFLGFGVKAVQESVLARLSVTYIEKELINILSKSTGNIIISSEVFSENYLDPENLAALREFIKPFDARMIIYIRRQDEYAVSIYKEAVRHPNFTGNVMSGLQYANWFERIELFTEVFDKSNIIIRVFDPTRLYNRELICDFCYASNISLWHGFDPTEFRLNRSNSYYITELLRMTNHHFTSRYEIQKFEEYISRRFYLDSEHEIGNILTLEQRRNIVEMFEDSNRQLAIEYLGKPDGKLFDMCDLDDYDTGAGELSSNCQLTEDFANSVLYDYILHAAKI